MFNNTVTKEKKSFKKKSTKTKKNDTSNYGTYYGDGMWGPNKEPKQNDWENETPLWCILLAFLCITIQ